MGTMTMSKNGVDFFDVIDDPESVKAATAKGYQPYVDVTKDGKERFRILGTEDSITAAIGKGYQLADWKEQQEKPNIAESYNRGVAQGASFGAADELTGAAETAGSILTGKSSLGDIVDTYRAKRDEARAAYEKAREENPKMFATGELVGGIGSGIATGGLTSGLKGAAAIGAATGLMGSEADLTKGEIVDAAKDTALGAGIGAASYGVGKAVGKLGDLYKNRGAINRGIKIAADEVKENPSAGSIDKIRTTWNAIKESIKESGNAATAKAELDDLANVARNVVGDANLDNDSAIVLALMEDGDNPVKQMYAKRIAQLSPGRTTDKQISDVLNIPVKERYAAQNLNLRDEAEKLTPEVQKLADMFDEVRKARFSELQSAARESFDPAGADKVFSQLDDAIAKSAEFNATKANGPILQDVQKIVAEGADFDSLQKARQFLDDHINYDPTKKLSVAEKQLKSVRDQIDNVLKFSPEKIEGDDLWRSSKDVENKFFKATQFKTPGGGYEIDEGKIKGLLGGTDRAKRFQKTFKELEDFANRPGLDPKLKEQVKATIDNLKQKINLAESKSKISGMTYQEGPTSPAIQRAEKMKVARTKDIAGKEALAPQFEASPSGFLNQQANIANEAEQFFGKPFQELSASEKLRVVKLWRWREANQNATLTDFNKATSEILSGK